MALLRPAPVQSGRFTYDAPRHLFIAELSDLGRDFRLGRVFDDACDEGLTIVSARTGREVVFVMHREHRDAEGELQYLELHTADRSLPYRVHLFND